MKTLLLVPPSKNNENVVRDQLYGCWCKGKRIGGIALPPLSLMQIAAVLEKDICDAQILDAAVLRLSVSASSQAIAEYDAVILSTSAMTWEDDLAVLVLAKQSNPGLKVILFGYYATCNAEYLLSFSVVNIIVKNEPEYIIRDLIRVLNKDNLWQQNKGICFNLDNKYVENPDYPFIENLDELPFLDRTLLSNQADYFNPIVKKIPYTLMLTTRGCCGKCVFCTSPVFYGNKVRYRSAENVLKELRLIKSLGYKEVFFRDELFTFSRERTEAICNQMIKEKLAIEWVCSTRADFLDKDLMRIMKLAGCHMLRIGVESGNQSLLDRAGKGLDLSQIKAVFKSAKQLKIDTHAHLIVGIPGENQMTINKTMRFIKSLEPTIVTYGVLTPYKGTELFNDLIKKNSLAAAAVENNASESELSEYLTDFSAEQLQTYVRKCYRNFYLRPSYLLKRLVCCRSIDELKRMTAAAKNVIEFIVNKE